MDPNSVFAPLTSNKGVNGLHLLSNSDLLKGAIVNPYMFTVRGTHSPPGSIQGSEVGSTSSLLGRSNPMNVPPPSHYAATEQNPLGHGLSRRSVNVPSIPPSHYSATEQNPPGHGLSRRGHTKKQPSGYQQSPGPSMIPEPMYMHDPQHTDTWGNEAQSVISQERTIASPLPSFRGMSNQIQSEGHFEPALSYRSPTPHTAGALTPMAATHPNMHGYGHMSPRFSSHSLSPPEWPGAHHHNAESISQFSGNTGVSKRLKGRPNDPEAWETP